MNPIAASISVVMLAGVLTGCATAPTDLHRSGRVQVEHIAEGKVRISGLGVHEKDGGIEVCGVLRRIGRSALAIKAHVDITVLNPEGTILIQARSKSKYIYRRRIGAGTRSHKRFAVFLEVSPPKDSVIQIVVHSQEHDPVDHK